MEPLEDWQQTFVRPDATVREALERIDKGLRIALVVDDQTRLCGIVTDGDVRRGLLRGIEFSATVAEVMNPSPIVRPPGADREELLDLMKEHDLVLIPLVDECGVVVGLSSIHHILEKQERDNWVFLLAGGLGTRLRPLTEAMPKPMLSVGGQPLLETIIERLSSEGFKRFYLSVNYKAHRIRDHFGDGASLGVEIRYVSEERTLGTAGPLGLLPRVPEHPMLVMNGDILTEVNFDALLRYHRESSADATVCVREYDFEVPYGAVTCEKGLMLDIVEKPVQRFMIVAGIYLLSPGIVQQVSGDAAMDMPDLLRRSLDQGLRVSVFPIHEYWLDIGRKPDLDRARADSVGAS